MGRLCRPPAREALLPRSQHRAAAGARERAELCEAHQRLGVQGDAQPTERDVHLVWLLALGRNRNGHAGVRGPGAVCILGSGGARCGFGRGADGGARLCSRRGPVERRSEHREPGGIPVGRDGVDVRREAAEGDRDLRLCVERL